MMQRKMRLMYKTTKKPSTKANKLIQNIYNAEKMKNIIDPDFTQKIRKFADKDKNIILSVVDEEYSKFALNFYKVSIEPHGLKNFLFVTLDKTTKGYFEEIKIPFCSFPFSSFVKKTDQTSNYGSKNFNYKTNMKTAVMIQALKIGLNVLMVDVDIVFFKNPIPFLHCNNCSILVQQDLQLYNSGFVYAKNTAYSKKLYDQSWNFFLKFQKSHDQSYFNMAIEFLRDKHSFFEIEVLSKKLFPCGKFYFENVHRPFENLPPCEECVFVHNNYIGTKAAKLYRMKENFLWVLDDNQYYSNISAKYMTYENPFEFDDTIEMETETLKSALVLAAKLNRILILPSFHCCNCFPYKKCFPPRYRCNLLSVLKLSLFDWVFEENYREHSFLKNPIVPTTVKQSISPTLLFNNILYTSKQFNQSSVIAYNPRNFTKSPSLDEANEWLEKYERYSVIKFHSLYDTNFFDRVSDEDYKIRHLLFLMKNKMECSDYQQWSKDVLLFR